MKQVLPAFCLVTAFFCSCSSEDLNAPRQDGISFYASADCSGEPLENFCVSVAGGPCDLYVKTYEEPFKIFWQDAAALPWTAITACEKTSDPGVWRVTLESSPRSSDVLYHRRSGTLSVSVPEISLGSFLAVHQGAVARVQDNFSDFLYGSWSPYDTSLEKHIDAWSSTLKAKGFDSEPVPPSEVSHCYGRNGFIKLGGPDGGRGCLFTPRNEYFRYDSLLMVTFRVSAYQDALGVKDDNNFSVEVVGGGYIRDMARERVTSLSLTAPYINPDAGDVSGMWGDGSRFIVFVSATPDNPLTVGTRIKFTSGSSGPSSAGTSGCSRLYIDEVCVMRLVASLDEDYYTMNHGSGPDRILAAETGMIR